MKKISILRKNRYSNSIGGELFVDGQVICKTLELPWEWNSKNVSCIPSGTYFAFWRHNRTRVQVEDIACPGGYRVAVQIHAGNKPKHSRGCILVGRTISQNFVGASQKAMRDIESALFPGIYGPGYPSIQIQLSIEGVLMNSIYDDIDVLDGLVVTA